MSLSQRLAEYVAAAFTGIWIQSHEHADAQAEVARLCRDRGWALAAWDVDRGLQVAGGDSAGNAADPVAAVKSINSLAAPGGSALLVLPNFHRFLQSAEVVQAVAHQVQQGKENRTFLLVLSPVVQIPVELEKSFVVLEHDLPDRPQLEQISRGIATEQGEMPAGEELGRLLDAAAGLTRHEAEGAFSLSLVREGRLTPKAVWELKTQALRKSGLLTLHRGTETFADLGGLEALKQFCGRALASANEKARPRGVLLLGVPGTGKSAVAKALGNECGRPTLVLDVGSLMGSLVRETEGRTRQALRLIDAMSPCVCFLDEVEKALAGVQSGGGGDSGVSARLFGSMLSWLSDHTSDAFVVATCNDISRLPPEFSRAERFDAVFFLDLPGSEEKARIWELYMARYGLDRDQALPCTPDWTGAEIRSCCRLAALLNVPLVRAAEQVVPVAATAAESVQRLRAWAAGRCLDASRGGLYSPRTAGSAAPSSASTTHARRVDRGPGRN
jgi:ATPase family associated with various cellular activities (AAA)